MNHALKCSGALENPFILLRLGEFLYEINNITVDNIITKTIIDNGKSVTLSNQESIFWISKLVNGGYNGIQKGINAFKKIKSIIVENNDY